MSDLVGILLKPVLQSLIILLAAGKVGIRWELSLTTMPSPVLVYLPKLLNGSLTRLVWRKKQIDHMDPHLKLLSVS